MSDKVIPGFYSPEVPYTREEARASVGPGWQGLVDTAFETVTAVGGRIQQVKEKFGLLRIYAKVPQPMKQGIDAILYELEVQSRNVCEQCGAPAYLRKTSRYILYVSCEAHKRPD